jgi:serine/threonine-protein kinase
MSAPTVSRDVLMKRLRRSGLLSPDEMQHAYEVAAQTADGWQLGKLLVEKKILTRFQVRMLLAGRTDGFLLGQYKILEPLGQGAMGRVFKAEHVGMGRLVALKLLSPDLVQTERARQLFEREVKLAARLQHLNIVTAYDADTIGGRYFLVLEYVDGPDLQSLVQREGPLPVGLACELIRQAAVGLQYAHELGMVHRDIKPSNLLVQRLNPFGPGPLVKILDFGLAHLRDGEALDGRENTPLDRRTVIGTPDYISPEQARNWQSVDIRSDLYSLGCTFYYLLTGQPPYPGGTALQKLVRHCTERPTPLTHLRPDLPPAIAEIIDNLMAKNPLERYQIPLDAAVALLPHADASTAFIAHGTSATLPTLEGPSDFSTWPGQQGTLTAVTAGSALFLLPHSSKAAPPSPQRRWLAAVFLFIGILVGISLSFGFWLVRSWLGFAGPP